MTDIHKKLLEAVSSYHMPAAAVKLLTKYPPLIISAVTAAGKNTVANYIVGGTYYKLTISHTTRAPRPDETNGSPYWFVDETQMFREVKAGGFIEVKAIHGETVYGTSIKSYKTVIKNKQHPLLEIDVQGVEEISRDLPKIKPFFLLPPSYEEWMSRLHSRGVITEKDKAERLASARREIKTVLKNPAYILVVNDEVERVAAEILSGKTNNDIQTKNRELAQEILNRLGT